LIWTSWAGLAGAVLTSPLGGSDAVAPAAPAEVAETVADDDDIVYAGILSQQAQQDGTKLYQKTIYHLKIAIIRNGITTTPQYQL
jgi:hypothetical protein